MFLTEDYWGALPLNASGGCRLRRLLDAVRFCSYLALAVVVCWAPLKAATQSTLFDRGYTVIPQPQKVELKGGDFEISGGWRLELGKGVEPGDVAVERLKEGLETRDGITLET